MITAGYGDPDAPTVLIQMVDDHDLEGMGSEVAGIRKLTEVERYMCQVEDMV